RSAEEIRVNKTIKLTAVAAVAALALAACAEAPGDGGTASATTPVQTIKPVDGFKPCVVSDAGGFDDKSFNQLSFEGLQKAAAEFGVKAGAVQSKSAAGVKPSHESLLTANCSLITSVGFALSAATVEAAKANPDIPYVLVDDAADNAFDGKVDAENIKPLVYDTAQAAFL